ncbi:MAG: hypothetical protein QOH31_3812 [Verrucomicrobiota bacterium]|jgi:hypothetical protein
MKVALVNKHYQLGGIVETVVHQLWLGLPGRGKVLERLAEEVMHSRHDELYRRLAR